MATFKSVYNVTREELILPKGKWCNNPWCHFKGLMLRGSLPDDEGLVFVYGRESKMNTSIHMFFVNFAIGVVWLNKDMQVVDAKLAKPWRPSYVPAKAAKYFIEANPFILEKVAVGDQLHFD
jgi:uncharacterized membrane protein (UPF0127 family)